MAEKKLSDRQNQILNHIRSVVADRGYPPSVREIGEALGLSSPSTVHSHLTTLVRAGAIQRDPSKPRAIKVLEPGRREQPVSGVRQVPVLGRIAAGRPILAAEEVEEVLPLPIDVVGTGPLFMLRVKGDSMIGAGILDGDYVVIRSQPDASDGEIVAALIDGEEATVKRLSRRDGRVRLLSENAAYPPMEFQEGVSVLGKVVSVFRRVR